MSEPAAPTGFCRDCLADVQADERRCRACHSPRLLRHAEINSLSIAHIDCDAFYAAVEKRDDPSLADKPLIVGGGTRGVVSTCCYIARIRGVRSAMPMFKALKLAPDAVVIRPNMAKYAEVGQQVRELMLGVTPLVEPISIDEAFLDLTGNRATAWPHPRQDAGRAHPRHRTEDRHHSLGRPCTQQVSGQGRLRPGEAAWFFGHRQKPKHWASLPASPSA